MQAEQSLLKQKRRSPLALLGVSLVLTAVALGGLGWMSYDNYRDTRTTEVLNSRIQELRGTICHMDEVLTMSARLAAATGDLQWEDRYRRFEPALDAAIKEAFRLAPGVSSVEAVSATDQANLRLVAMENRAFDLIRQGQADRARALLSSQEYEAQKAIYVHGMTELASGLSNAIKASLIDKQRESFLEVVVAGVLVPLTICSWFFIVRAARHWSTSLKEGNRRLAAQARDLADMNRTLDQKVARRTAELTKANEDMAAEVDERKRAEEELNEGERALRESQETMRVLLNAPSEMALLISPDGTIATLNKNLVTALGKPKEEIVGRNIREFVAPELIEKRNALTQEAVRTRMPVRFEEKLEGRWLDNTVYPILNEDEEVIRLAVYTRDVTEQKRAQDALQESRSFLQTVIDAIPDAMKVIDLDYRIALANRAAQDLAGGIDLVGDGVTCHQASHHRETPCEGKDDPCPLREVVLTRAPSTGIHTHYDADGNASVVEVCAAPIFDDAGEVVRVIESCRDITDRKRAEDALRASKEKYQLLYDSSADAIMTLTPEKGFLDGNPAVIRMFGCRDEEEFASLTPAALSPDVQPDGVPSSVKAQEMMAAAMEKGSHFFEWRHRRLNGPEFDATVLLTRLTSQEGTFLQATVRDITKQKQREASIAQAQAAAEAANESKSEFLANMSHEIRTPMTAILGFVEQLRDPELNPSSRDNYLGIIERNGEHLLGLINDILDLSKIEAGMLEVDVGPCDMIATIADVASLMRVRAEQHNTSLSVTYRGEIPKSIRTDATRVRQALVNLVGNAVKFTEAGSVQMAVTFLPDWHPGTPAVRVDVVDTGVGIGEDKISRLFEPFVQEDNSMSRRFGGTGLGLAITHHIAELLGGELTVTSTVGEGSTFTLIVPTGNLEGVPMVDQPTEATAGLDAPAALPSDGQTSLAGLRILLAEDGRDNQLLIGTILRKAGATVEIAENGRVAVEKGVEGGFDVILMDVQMPGMDGHEATRVLRGRGVTCPILALTAHAMASDRELCIEAGCDDHLTKPVNRAELVRTVAAHASGKPRSTDAAPVDAIHSDYADDPDLADVLEQFVAGLDTQVTAMREALDGSYHEELQRLAHQLKGAGGGYGYPALTEEAAILEQAAKAGDTEQARLTLRRLTDLCQAIRRGLPVRAGSGRAQT